MPNTVPITSRYTLMKMQYFKKIKQGNNKSILMVQQIYKVNTSYYLYKGWFLLQLSFFISLDINENFCLP
ncbi:protein of unknown function [Xenorhabdus doucetiae]|uniref:Uncharacterized protein n=1 Tax=Xenorhabdus doucetiae TaxID=351671 RepID=A0A068QRQ9_9GAMM|nr:protein of unknown function [Xenorhabdus doucetiae]